MKKVKKRLNEFVSFRKIYWYILLTFFFFYMFFNHAIPITDPVESNYALTAKEMVLSSDWLSPRIYGNVWFDKPIFFYWLTALSFKLFGFSDWAARLMPSLFASLGLLVLYLFTIKTTNKKIAVLSVVIMATSFEYIVLAKMVVTDMVFFFFNSATLVFFYFGYNTMRNKSWYRLAYVSMALAVLTKGPVGALLPGLVIVTFLVCRRNWSELKSIFDPVGLMLFAIVMLPWYVSMYSLHGDDFINGFFGVHNYLRATVSEHPKDNVIYYYFVVFVLSLLPWSALAIKSLVQSYKTFISQQQPLILFLLIWITVYFVFYSFMATKYITYIFPIIFPVTILTAFHLKQMIDNNNKKGIFLLIGIPLIILILVYLGTAYYYLSGWKLYGAGIFLSGFMVCILIAKIKIKQVRFLFHIFLLCQLGVYVILSIFIFPTMADQRSGKESAELINYIGAQEIGMYKFYSTSTVFYSGILAVKVEQAETNSYMEEGLSWSSKYTMPKQNLIDFEKKQYVFKRLLLVKSKQKEDAQLPIDLRNYKLLKNYKGISYYLMIE